MATTLPAGLALSPSTGRTLGTPSAPGGIPSIRVTDANGNQSILESLARVTGVAPPIPAAP